MTGLGLGEDKTPATIADARRIAREEIDAWFARVFDRLDPDWRSKAVSAEEA